MKVSIDQQIELLTAIILSGEKSFNWRISLQTAMWALDATESTGLHQNVMVEGGPDETD